jgi:phosphatidylserine/phosphatidylglycerophosphate/cardiolipin synthase-like enzyme
VPFRAQFLTDRGQSAEQVAVPLAEFLEASTARLDIAIYDLKLAGEAAARVRRAINQASRRGVVVRMIYNQDHPRERPLPPPGFVDYDFLRSLAVESRAIPGVPDLMHHKYVVRDQASVWTGSTNWTTDSWTREENVIVRLDDRGLASDYAANFEELWNDPSVRRSGHQRPAWYDLPGDLRVRPYFTPGRAEKLVHEIAQRIATARRRVRICSPVITSGPILASLSEALGRPGLEISGCYDLTQMTEVCRQWSAQPRSAWKLAAWETVRAAIPWGAKRSTPYQAGSVHDFMHAKCMVTDDSVFTGSYNLSHSGEENAENVLEIESPAVADLFAAYVESVAARYSSRPVTGPALDSEAI